MASIGAQYTIESLQTTDKQKPWLQQLKYLYLNPTSLCLLSLETLRTLERPWKRTHSEISFNVTFLCILRLVFSLFGDMVFCVFLCQVIFIRVSALRGSPPRDLDILMLLGAHLGFPGTQLSHSTTAGIFFQALWWRAASIYSKARWGGPSSDHLISHEFWRFPFPRWHTQESVYEVRGLPLVVFT